MSTCGTFFGSFVGSHTTVFITVTNVILIGPSLKLKNNKNVVELFKKMDKLKGLRRKLLLIYGLSVRNNVEDVPFCFANRGI